MLEKNLETCLNNSFKYAHSNKHEFVTTEHLLLSILDNDESIKVLTSCNINIETLRTELTKFIEDNTDDDAVQDTFVQQRGYEENKLGETADVRELQKNGVLDKPISKPKEVSSKGDDTKRGASSFYGDE